MRKTNKTPATRNDADEIPAFQSHHFVDHAGYCQRILSESSCWRLGQPARKQSQRSRSRPIRATFSTADDRRRNPPTGNPSTATARQPEPMLVQNSRVRNTAGARAIASRVLRSSCTDRWNQAPRRANGPPTYVRCPGTASVLFMIRFTTAVCGLTGCRYAIVVFASATTTIFILKACFMMINHRVMYSYRPAGDAEILELPLGAETVAVGDTIYYYAAGAFDLQEPMTVTSSWLRQWARPYRCFPRTQLKSLSME